jgi:alkylation response protein AidB-like acyl-CoA dehydrogenase
MVATKQSVGEFEQAAGRGAAFLFTPVGARPVGAPERFTEEQRAFFRSARDFAVREVLPQAEGLERKAEGSYAKLRELFRAAGELGLLSVDIPESYGGLGLDKTTSFLVGEAQAVYGAWVVSHGAHTGIGTLPIVFFGTPAQKSRYLPRLATGEWIAAYALSESGSGSDALGARTTAVLTADGKHYRINGGKQWITNGGFADVYVVFAKVDGDKFTAFVIERGTPGFSAGREEHKMGIRGSSTCPLMFEDVLVPVEAVLGEVGKGHKIAFNILNVGRLKLGVGAVGGMKLTLALGAQYALERKQFGKPIAGFGLIREKLARAAALCYAAEAMTFRATGLIDEAIAGLDESAPGYQHAVMAAIEEYAVEASALKVWSTEAFQQVVDEMLQIHGGNGFVEDYPIERAYRDQRVNRIFEGTNEINRLLVPGMLFKKAMKEQIPLMAFASRLDEELADPTLLPRIGAAPQWEGPLGPSVVDAELAKRTFAYIARAAAMRFGTELEQHQEVLAALADVACEAYAMDSVLTRTLQIEGGAQDGVRAGLCRIVCSEGREKVRLRARQALAACAEGDELRLHLDAVAKLYRDDVEDPAALRESVAPAVLESAGYPFGY